MLLSFGLPVPDVERIHALLHAQGVSDIAYLRVLARMHSRDGWLHEMREKGEVSEIQMRVLREMLQQLALK